MVQCFLFFLTSVTCLSVQAQITENTNSDPQIVSNSFNTSEVPNYTSEQGGNYPNQPPGTFGSSSQFSSSFYGQTFQCGFSGNLSAGTGNWKNDIDVRATVGFSTNKCSDPHKIETIRQAGTVINSCIQGRVQLALADKNPDIACSVVDIKELDMFRKNK